MQLLLSSSRRVDRVPRCAALRAALLATCSILVVATSGCREEPRVAPKVVRPVKSTVVEARSAPQVRALSGKVEAMRDAELAFQVPGLLLEILVKEGDVVAAGTVLARLRSDEYQARVDVLEGQLQEARVALRAREMGERPEERLRLESRVRAAEATVANAKAQFDRYADLLQSNAIAVREYEFGETAYRVAQEDYKAAVQMLEMSARARAEDIEASEAAVRGFESRVNEARIQVADCTMKAPFDGVVSQRYVEQNQWVGPGMRVLRLQGEREFDVAVDVPESIMVTDLRLADAAQMAAEFTALPGQRFPVRLREIQKAADPTTQTFRVRFAIEVPPGTNLLPGMSATVLINHPSAAAQRPAILAPVSAIYDEGGGASVVWVIGADETAKRRPVKLGATSGDSVEILDGLKSGERIAVAGVSFLREGAKVRDIGDAFGGPRR